MGGLFGDDDSYGEENYYSLKAKAPNQESKGIAMPESEEEVDMGGLFGGDDDYDDEFSY